MYTLTNCEDNKTLPHNDGVGETSDFHCGIMIDAAISQGRKTWIRAAFAACRPQREAAGEVYNRKRGDAEAGDRIMGEIERVVADHFMLTVIQARAAQRKPPPTQIPPAPTAQPSLKENSI